MLSAKYLPAALFLGINPFMVCQIAFVRLVMLLLLSCTDLQHQTFGLIWKSNLLCRKCVVFMIKNVIIFARIV